MMIKKKLNKKIHTYYQIINNNHPHIHYYLLYGVCMTRNIIIKYSNDTSH